MKVAGGIPVPVDIKKDDNLISISAIENAITENTVGIMPTQLNGRVCDMDSIIKIANKKISLLLKMQRKLLVLDIKANMLEHLDWLQILVFFLQKFLDAWVMLEEYL